MRAIMKFSTQLYFLSQVNIRLRFTLPPFMVSDNSFPDYFRSQKSLNNFISHVKACLRNKANIPTNIYIRRLNHGASHEVWNGCGEATALRDNRNSLLKYCDELIKDQLIHPQDNYIPKIVLTVIEDLPEATTKKEFDSLQEQFVHFREYITKQQAIRYR